MEVNVNAQELSLKMLRVYCQRVLSLKAGQRAIIANGRVLGPLEDDEIFTIEDFSLLERFTRSSYLDKINSALESTVEDEEILSSNDLLKIVYLLVSRPQTKSRFDISYAGDQYSVLEIPAVHPEQAAFNIVVIVDPVSRGAQKIGPILQVFQEVLNCNIRIFLNSVEKNSDMPIKR